MPAPARAVSPFPCPQNLAHGSGDPRPGRRSAGANRAVLLAPEHQVISGAGPGQTEERRGARFAVSDEDRLELLEPVGAGMCSDASRQEERCGYAERAQDRKRLGDVARQVVVEGHGDCRARVIVASRAAPASCRESYPG